MIWVRRIERILTMRKMRSKSLEALSNHFLTRASIFVLETMMTPNVSGRHWARYGGCDEVYERRVEMQCPKDLNTSRAKYRLLPFHILLTDFLHPLRSFLNERKLCRLCQSVRFLHVQASSLTPSRFPTLKPLSPPLSSLVSSHLTSATPSIHPFHPSHYLSK